MFGAKIIFVSLAVFQAVYSADVPPQCRGPPPGVNAHECCEIPKIFSEEELSSCGIEKPDGSKPGPPPHAHDCKKSICVLSKKNLITDGDKVDKDASKAFLDKYAEANPEFAAAVAIAKDKCLTAEGPGGPKEICEPNRAIFCISHVLFENCPAWVDSDNCKKLKDHIEECKAYKPQK
ncbi:general odorant-binding protein 68-like isoform X2 [Aricia agestis]|uniref:general odorant-binding protein 68-like isoform X2 n=1 Tax=Aricia agestis TaxID=91739 RepID=UPI001C20A559|nr:general odorant-binding protein 68-like isoform X2 [Aricia agestis]